jgi:hypothetical protein
MRLNKDVCIQCQTQHGEPGFDVSIKQFEAHWKQKRVLCPSKFALQITGTGPGINCSEFCPYFLEHVLSEKANAE